MSSYALIFLMILSLCPFWHHVSMNIFGFVKCMLHLVVNRIYPVLWCFFSSLFTSLDTRDDKEKYWTTCKGCQKANQIICEKNRINVLAKTVSQTVKHICQMIKENVNVRWLHWKKIFCPFNLGFIWFEL